MRRDLGRNYTIDLLRVIAALMVTLTHSVEYSYQFYWDDSLLRSQGSISKLFAIVTFSVGRLGVPIFLLITGFLLLDREYSHEDMMRFWKKKCIRLVLVTWIWIAGYSLICHVLLNSRISVQNMIDMLLFVKTFDATQYSNIWYMYMIIGLYPLIPFVANAIRKQGSVQTLRYPIIFYGFIFIGIYMLKKVWAGEGSGSISPSQISMGFSAGYYGLYLVFGYLLKKNVLGNVRVHVLVIVFIISFSCLISEQWIYIIHGKTYFAWYNDIFLMIGAVMLFEITTRIKLKEKEELARLSEYSFPIYLFNDFSRLIIVKLIVDKWLQEPKDKIAYTLLLWTSITVLTTCISYCIKKIPVVGKLY